MIFVGKTGGERVTSAMENFSWEAASAAWIDGVFPPIPLQVGLS